MRLIDADALMLDIRKHSESYFADDFAHEWVDQQPTVDAVPVSCVNDDVDEALRLLDAINSAGYIDYGVYCDLHNAICAIATHCGAKMDGGDNECD